MKRIMLVLAVTALVCVVPAFAKKGAPERKVDYQRYESYHENNNDGLKGKTSYLAFTSQADFDKVFGPAATMGPNSFLPDNSFGSKLVVAAIRRGGFLSKYDVTKVTARGRTLYVWYNLKDEPSSSATFRSPLILAVDKGDYSRVVFMQNGRRAGTASLPKTK
jgi:inhibitor of cysteine peptidase